MNINLHKIRFLSKKIAMYAVVLSVSLPTNSQFSYAASSQALANQFGNSYLMLASLEETEGALEDLLSILGKETEIATKTKMNIDFVPGMVTVLHGKDLLAKGVRTVSEALRLVPGVDIIIAGDGQVQFIFRGIGKVFGSGKVKVLINGIPFNNTLTAQTTLNAIPVEQVERIEIIRGPGSAVYGEFAFAGVVDVITKDADSELFIRYGDLNSKMAGGIYSHKNEEKNFSVSLNVSTSEYDPNDVIAGPDLPLVAPISNSPGAVNDNEESLAAIFKINYKGLSLTGEKARREFGNYFGVNNALPKANTGAARTADYQVFEFKSPIKINESMSSKLKLGWANFVFDGDKQQLFPELFLGSFPDGVIQSPHYEEDKYYTGYELRFQNLENHDLVMGLDYARIEQGDTRITRNFIHNPASPLPFIMIPEQTFTTVDNFITSNNSRSIIGVFVQDQWAVTEALNITAGIRFDDYDDVGESTTPRLAAVYQLTDHQTFKFQYAEAFRPPTFIELYSQNTIVNGNFNLEAETIKSYELGYVFNDGVTIGRLTVFAADLIDLIGESNTSPVVFQNIGQAHLTGIELEFIRQLGNSLKFDANLSWTELKDEVLNIDFANVSNFLVNMGVIYQPVNDFSLNVQYRHSGEKQREALVDARDDLDSFNTVDVTTSFFNFIENKLTLRAGVRNVFDEDIFSPAPHSTYVNDYPQPGREWWISMAYKL